MTRKLSIIIPTYNQGPFIRDCLLSIQGQSLQDFEVIIQDSESKDETEKVCQEFVSTDSRFRYFREKDSGQSDAINRGTQRATGEMWTWICSDDFYANSKCLEFLVQTLERASKANPDVVGAFGDAQYVSEQGEILGHYENMTRDLGREDFRLTWPLSQPSSIWFRKVVDEAGGVDPSLHLGMDLDLFLKVMKESRKLVYVPQMVANIRLQPNSKSVKFRKKTAENAIQIIRKHFGEASLQGSAYFREYGQSRKQEIIERVRTVVHRVPGGKAIDSWAVSFRKKAQLYNSDDCTERNLEIYFFRTVWPMVRMSRRCLIDPIIRLVKLIAMYKMRSKKLLLS